MLRAFVVAVLCWMALGCWRASPAERVLFDFENEADLDRMHWQCFTLFAHAPEHATRGARSLKMSLYPSPWPGWAARFERQDWRPFTTLAFDLFNPTARPVAVSVRIDDRRDYPEYDDRYNQQFVLQPGANGLAIPFDALVTSGAQRPLELKRIRRLMIFMPSPQTKQVLYLDNVRLTRPATVGVQ